MPTSKRTSDKLLEVADTLNQQTAPVSLQQLTSMLGLRAVGGVLVLLSILAIIPGVAIVAGILIVILGYQSLSTQQIRLPNYLTSKTIDSKALTEKLILLANYTKFIEKYAHPRLNWLCLPPASRVFAILIMILGICILIPLPMTNFIPAISLFGIAIGLMEKDGVILLISSFIALLSFWATIAVVQWFIRHFSE
jgi:hypothetical protein